MADRLSDRIRKSIEKAAKAFPDEYASLIPEEHMPDPDPDTHKKHFSENRKKYEQFLDTINDSVKTADEFQDIEELQSALTSLNCIADKLGTAGKVTKGSFLKRLVRKMVFWGIRPEIDEIKSAVCSITRALNNLNHKTQIFAGKQEAFNSHVALYGQYIVPVMDEKARFGLKKYLKHLKDRMDVFHENTDLRHTEIANWLHNLVKRLETLENEMVRGLSLQHKKLEKTLSDIHADKGAQTVSDKESVHSQTDEEGIGDYGYYLFETRGRGPEDFVKETQSKYVNYFKDVEPVLDLGCGRGEFLELLGEAGIQATGADINSDMIEICREKNLDVIHADAIDALTKCKSASLGGIFAGQLVEHFMFNDLVRFLSAACNALKPGGVIVFETVNTTSVYALLNHYFKDPTHQMPRHPETYKFLTEITGFTDVKLLYTSEIQHDQKLSMPDLNNISGEIDESLFSNLKTITENLNSIIYAPCDIAVIARKHS